MKSTYTTLPEITAAALLQTSIAEVLAAMIPCSRLYGYLGCQLAAANAAAGMPRHAYTEWIDVYSGAEYLVSSSSNGILTPVQDTR